MIVGFGHRREVGKDTFAKMVVDHLIRLGYTAEHVAFADKLYQICEELFRSFGFKSKAYYDSHKEEKAIMLADIEKSPREILIETGNLMRQVYDGVWVDYVRYQGLLKDFTIISDVRYPNEVKKIWGWGGVSYKIIRPDTEEFDDVADSALASYTEWDGEIINDGDLEHLDGLASDLARHLVALKNAEIARIARIRAGGDL